MKKATSTKREHAKEFVLLHKNGTVWAKGRKDGETMVGYWEWFRMDGTKLRSGSFEDGVQVGVWTTYDRKGEPYKVTTIRSKAIKGATHIE